MGKTGALPIISHGKAQPVLHNLISASNLPGGVVWSAVHQDKSEEFPDADPNALVVGLLAPGTAPGGGKLYRYMPKTHKWSVWRSGFNPVNGCGFDVHGNFYAVDFQSHGFNPGPAKPAMPGGPTGQVVKISP